MINPAVIKLGLRFGPWILLAGVALTAIKLYGDNRASTALALARADSLKVVRAQHDSLEVNRDFFRDSLQTADSSWVAERQALQVRTQGAERRSRANLSRLRAILTDTVVALPESLTIVVEEAIGGLEEERDLCRAELLTCDERVNVLQLRIATDSVSLNEKESLLGAFEEQLEDAIKHRGGGCGIACWVTRGAAVYGALEFIRMIAGGDGGS